MSGSAGQTSERKGVYKEDPAGPSPEPSRRLASVVLPVSHATPLQALSGCNSPGGQAGHWPP